MIFKDPLEKGRLIKRYKRFLADVELKNQKIITAHCPNTGSMRSCGETGDTVYLSYNPSPKRKLAYTWQLTHLRNSGFVCVNTMLANKIVEEAIEKKKIPELCDYETLKREARYLDSRFDFLLTSKNKNIWVEVKNVTLLENDKLLFPDAVSTRGLKHLTTLSKLAKEGSRAVMFYLVNRSGGKAFSPAKDIHPEYAAALVSAKEQGVEIICYRTKISPEEVSVDVPVKIVI